MIKENVKISVCLNFGVMQLLLLYCSQFLIFLLEGWNKYKRGIFGYHCGGSSWFQNKINLAGWDIGVVECWIAYNIFTRIRSREQKIELIGEGYFEVKRNEEVPFLVKTNSLLVKVLGTKFNFRDYPDDAEAVVSLSEGKVSLNNLLKKKKKLFVTQ